MPLKRLQNLPGKKTCHDFSIFSFRITKIVSPIYCKQFQISHCGNPIEAGSCLLCKMAPIWGGCSICLAIIGHLKTRGKMKTKVQLVAFFCVALCDLGVCSMCGRGWCPQLLDLHELEAGMRRERGQSGHWSNYFVKIHEKQDKMSSGQQKAESCNHMDQILKN